MTHTLTKARGAVKRPISGGVFLPAPRQIPNLSAAQARLNDVAARTARLQAKYTKTRTHEALYDLKRARVALVAAENDVRRFNAD